MGNETSIPTEETATETKRSAKAKAVAAPIPVEDRFPHKRHYEEGYIFNFALSHFEKYTEDELKAQGYAETDLVIIREGMDFHGRTIGSLKREE